MQMAHCEPAHDKPATTHQPFHQTRSKTGPNATAYSLSEIARPPTLSSTRTSNGRHFKKTPAFPMHDAIVHVSHQCNLLVHRSAQQPLQPDAIALQPSRPL